MSDPITPSTAEVRADYIRDHTRNFDSYSVGRSLTSEQEFYSKKFDRWLAAHDAEVTAKALERGVDELGVYVGDEDGDYWTGYRDGQRRQIHVLKMLAAEARADTTNETGEDG